MKILKKKKKKNFFRETPISPWAQFRAKFWHLVRLFRPYRPLGWALVMFEYTQYISLILFVQMSFNFPVNNYGHVETVTLFLRRLRPKQLTST